MKSGQPAPDDYRRLVSQSKTSESSDNSAAVGGIAVTGTPAVGDVPTATSTTAATWQTPAPPTADFLVGTAQAGLSAEIVVGTTPGGELGNTWASPTVDATHSGSAHADFIAKAFVNAKGDLITATADNTPAILTVGANGTLPFADSGEATGIKWAVPTVRAAAGVPSGAPTGTELPIAVDTTAVTGGVYYWTGAAWVQAATI